MKRPHLSSLLYLIVATLTTLTYSCKEEAPKGFSAKKAEQSIVRVIVAQKKDLGGGRISVGYGSGSGFYIGNKKLITNNHVIANASQGKLVVALKVGASSIEVRDATVLWTDKELDIAILEVADISCPSLTLSEAPVEKGSHAYAIGFPTSADASRRSGSAKMSPSELEFIELALSSQRGILNNVNQGLVQFLDPTVTSGEIRKTLTRKWQPGYKTVIEVLDHDVNIGHGNSGGPLLDGWGRVIGINTQGLDAQTVKGLAIADSVKNSSRITELTKVLKEKNIQFTGSTTPFVRERPRSGMDWKTWAVLGVVALAAIAALVVSIVKKPKTESYTQYIKRVSGMSRVNRRPSTSGNTGGPTWDGGQVVCNPAQQASAPPQLPTAPGSPASALQPTTPPPPPIATPPQSTHWVLQGNNREAGKSQRVSLQLTHEQFQRSGGNVILGRKQGVAHLVIDNSSISKAHAVLTLDQNTLSIQDNGSSNGTSVNGVRLKPGEKQTLTPGSQLLVGEVTLSISQR